MNRFPLVLKLLSLCVGLSALSSVFAQDHYYQEVKLEVAVSAINSGQLSPQIISNIEGAAAALSYVYDCSSISPGFLQNFQKVKIALVEYAKTDWGKLGQKYGVTVAGALHAYVTEHLGCKLR